MTNTRRAIVATSLGFILLLAVGILLQIRFGSMVFLLSLFCFAETFIIWYSKSRSKSQISGSLSIELFWLYIKQLKVFYVIILCLAIPFIFLSSESTYNLFFVLGLLVFLLLSNYIFSSHGIQPSKKERNVKDQLFYLQQLFSLLFSTKEKRLGQKSQPLNCLWIDEQDAVVEWALLG